MGLSTLYQIGPRWIHDKASFNWQQLFEILCDDGTVIYIFTVNTWYIEEPITTLKCFYMMIIL